LNARRSYWSQDTELKQAHHEKSSPFDSDSQMIPLAGFVSNLKGFKTFTIQDCGIKKRWDHCRGNFMKFTGKKVTNCENYKLRG
jgi:hypothetical protein